MKMVERREKSRELNFPNDPLFTSLSPFLSIVALIGILEFGNGCGWRIINSAVGMTSVGIDIFTMPIHHTLAN
jgi:hypothetical protein